MPFPRSRIELVGNLGKDAESKLLLSGEQVTNFSVAVTRKWGKGTDQTQETTWYNVTSWNKLAEMCQNLKKGQQVLLKGFLKPDPETGRPRIWTSDGKPCAFYELTAMEVWLSIFGSSSTNFQNHAPEEDVEEIPF